MNSALRATIARVPERTIKAVCGSIALGGAATIILFVGLVHPSLGKTITYGLIPLAIAIAASVILAIVRLWFMGRLPSNVGVEDVIPTRLQPWIRGWLLLRFGLLGSGLLIVLVGVAVGIAKRDLLGLIVEAFVYLAWCRVLIDAVFNAAFNAGIISTRR